MNMYFACPHCSRRAMAAFADLDSMVDRVGSTETAFLWDCDCGATFVVRLDVSPILVVNTLSREALVQLLRIAKRAAATLRRKTSPPTFACKACEREFRPPYAASLIECGLCTVCGQETKRILASPVASRAEAVVATEGGGR